MIARDRRQVIAQAPRAAQSLAETPDHLGAGPVMADEPHRSIDLGSGDGLADVVDQRPYPQRLPAGQPIRERLLEQFGDRLSRVPGVPIEVLLHLEQPPQDLDRVGVGVEVMVGALSHATKSIELGQHGGSSSELVEQLDRADRLRTGDDRGQLGELSLSRRLTGPARLAPRQLDGPGIGVEAEPRREPRGPQDPQRIVRERTLRGDAQPPRGDIGETTGRVDHGPTTERGRDGVHGEVAEGEILLDAGSAQLRDIEGPGPVARRNPPGGELPGELETMSIHGPRDPARRLGRAPGDRQVDLAGDAQHGVADGPADDPGPLVGAEGGARHLRRGGGDDDLGRCAHRR